MAWPLLEQVQSQANLGVLSRHRRAHERWVKMGYMLPVFHLLPCSNVFGLRKAGPAERELGVWFWKPFILTRRCMDLPGWGH